MTKGRLKHAISPLYAAIRTFIGDAKSKDRLRRLKAVGESQDGRTFRDGRRLLNFSSNNYLGLAQYPELIKRAMEYTRVWGAGSGASRLVTGDLDLIENLERKIAEAKGTDAALIFNSGYQANASILWTLLDRRLLGTDPIVFYDERNHASMFHGVKSAGARPIPFRHNDMAHLEELLETRWDKAGQRFILAESVYSMDGDTAPVGDMADLARRHDAFVYLDEAHATGVLGPHGHGLSVPYAKDIDLVMGTFSKALGGFGAYVACSAEMKEFLVNKCAGFIYTTALPPAVIGAMEAAWDLIPHLEDERKRVLGYGDMLRTALQAKGLYTGISNTHIVPLIVGKEETAVDMARDLEDAGILAVPIRPPTVPKDTSRIRFTLSAAHTREDILFLADTIITVARMHRLIP